MVARSGIIALLSDFGSGSVYAGVMRAVLAAKAPGSRVVDLSHAVRPHDVAGASFVLRLVAPFLAPRTVVAAVVDPGVGGERRDLAVELDGLRFVGPDNGVFSDVFGMDAATGPDSDPRNLPMSKRNDGGAATVVEIDTARIASYRVRNPMGRTFLGRDVFAPAAAALSSGVHVAQLGTFVDNPVRLDLSGVSYGERDIVARGRWIDDFGSILTGVTGDDLTRIFGNGPVGRVEASIDDQPIGALVDRYASRARGSLCAVLNSWGVVEVAVVQGSAEAALGVGEATELVLKLSASPTR